MPGLFAVHRAKPHHVARRANHVNHVAVHGRRRARAFAALTLGAASQAARIGLPNLLAVRLIQREDDNRIVHLASGEDLTIGDRHRRMPVTHGRYLPRQRRPALGPFLQQARLLRNVVARRPMKLRPILPRILRHIAEIHGRAQRHRARENHRRQSFDHRHLDLILVEKGIAKPD